MLEPVIWVSSAVNLSSDKFVLLVSALLLAGWYFIIAC